MKRIEFKTYEQYIKAQKRTVGKRGLGPYFTDIECYRIVEWLKNHRTINSSISGICHGARNGLEADVLDAELARFYIRVKMLATDLFPHSGKSAHYKTKTNVIECDFSEQNDEWIGAFDFVYSNSLDHARDPIQTLRVWFEQLRPCGCLFVQWTSGHRYASKGDCFGAELYEYISVINSVGVVTDLLYVDARKKTGRRGTRKLRRRALESIIIVASPLVEKGVHGLSNGITV